MNVFTFNSRLVRGLVLAAALLLSAAAVAQWIPIGPDGGDVRSLAADPRQPDRIYLGTSAGQMFVSQDNGNSWTRLAHLGEGNDYVLDHIVVDPSNPRVLYVAAWSVEDNGGDVFRSDDSGETWHALPGMHGKSIRAFAMSADDSRILVAGALDGVYRSFDAGATWQRVSPPHHAEIKNIESVAIDPRDPDIIYAGTWHLPWKTSNGGKAWQNIKRGVIDDSDVFSIIVDRADPSHIYLSACSGIYVSNNGGVQFHKVQGIPFSARRTRVLRQDPVNPAVVYAGTTEGLWKTTDSGRNWTRATASNLIINDVLVDQRSPDHVLLATDRGGVLASNDGAATFSASSRGFAHRQVSSVIASRQDANTLYAGVVNDKEFGGAFISHDGGTQWQQMSSGLEGRDVFCISEAASGELLAGTNQGVFQYSTKLERWEPANLILTAKELDKPRPVKTTNKSHGDFVVRTEWVKSQLSARVAQIVTASLRWYAATSDGLYASLDHGRSWHLATGVPAKSFVAVDARGYQAIAATASSAYLSTDGSTFQQVKLPAYVTAISGVALADKQRWVITREGAIVSNDMGKTWEHVIAGSHNLTYISYDGAGSRVLGVAGNTMFESRDGGRTWSPLTAGKFNMRALAVAGGRLLGITAFDGLLAQGESEANGVRRSVPGANNQ